MTVNLYCTHRKTCFSFYLINDIFIHNKLKNGLNKDKIKTLVRQQLIEMSNLPNFVSTSSSELCHCLVSIYVTQRQIRIRHYPKTGHSTALLLTILMAKTSLPVWKLFIKQNKDKFV